MPGIMVICAAFTLVLFGCTEPSLADKAGNLDPKRLYIVGQDLDSLRGYFASNCCPRPDGATAYISLYNVLDAAEDFGGIGIRQDGSPSPAEAEWGGGPSNAYKTGTEFGVEYLAIGLFIAENHHPGALARLIAGGHDDKIRHLATLIRQVPTHVLLRIGYEFEGSWNEGTEDADVYKAAYRRVVDVLREEGIHNISYVWQAAASPMDNIFDDGDEDIRLWYPGDEYVDWMAISWFLNPDEVREVEADYMPPTQRQLADEMLTFARERNKPVMIAEAAPQAYDLKRLTNANIAPHWDGLPGQNPVQMTPDQIWRQWYAPLFEYINTNADAIQGVAYINCNWDVQDLWDPPYESGYWGDTRLEANTELAMRWAAAINAWKARKQEN